MASAQVNLDNLPRTIELRRVDGAAALCFVDERELPGRLVVSSATCWEEAVDAVKELAIRGAPAIGIAGAAALALWADAAERRGDGAEDADAGFQRVAGIVSGARPTAVNLSWAVRRARELWEGVPAGNSKAKALFDLVKTMEREDERANRAIGANGAALLPACARVLTHCNAGSLATAFYGTALGVVYSAAEQGKVERVYADETRPVGQGARLTAWELSRAGVPVTLICDNMAASLMASGNIDAVVVGADRIAKNGDVANKIGTYGVAVLARHHNVPFYVAAPTSTVDPSIADGSAIVIEQRPGSEVIAEPIAGVEVLNPAFDVTPAGLVTKIVTENGVFEPAEVALSL